MKIFLKIAVVLIAIFLFDSQINAQQIKQVKLQLKWKHQFQFAGYYAAIEKGFYKELGIQVNLVEAVEGVNSSNAVFEDEAEFGVCSADIILMRSQNKKAVVLASIFQHSPQVLLASKQSGIHHIQDLIGKTVAIEPNAADIIVCLSDEGITPDKYTINRHEFNTNCLLNGKVDAISAYSTDEPFVLHEANFDYAMISPLMGGIDFYGDVLFTSEDLIEKDPKLVDDFRKASLKGWKYAMENPDEIAQLIYDKYSKRHSLEHLKFEAKQMKSLIMANVVEIGYSNPGRWKSIADTYKKLKMIDSSFSNDGLLYDDYINQKIYFPWRIFLIILIIFVLISFASIFYYFTNKKLKKEINNRLKAEAILSLSESKYRLITEKISDVVWLMDLKGKSTFVSPSVEDFTGFSVDEYLSQSISDRFTSTSATIAQETFKNEVSRYIQTGYNSKDYIKAMTLEYRCKDGSIKTGEIIITPFFDENSICIGLHGVTRDITERKIAEYALSKSEEQLREVLENSQDASYKRNLITNIYDYLSPVFINISGYTPEEMNTLPLDVVLKLIHPEDVEDVNHAIAKAFADPLNNASKLKYRFKHKDGSYRWLEDNFTIMRNSDREPLAQIGSVRDITNQKHSEDLLLLVQQNFEIFFNTIEDFLFVLDAQGNILHTNATVINRLGYSREELYGKSILLVHPSERRDEVLKIVGDVLSGDADFCLVPVITKSGILIPVETRVTPGFWDGNPALFGVTKDISKIKLSEEKFSKVFYLNPSACGLTEPITGKYIEVNEAFYKLFGFRKDEVIGKSAIDLGILNQEIAKAILQNNGDNDAFSNIEVDLKAKNGDIKHVLLSAEIINIQNNNYRFTVVHDITERKQAEEALQSKTSLLEAQTNTTIEGILVVDDNRKIILVNRRIIELFDVPQSISEDDDDSILLRHVVSLAKYPDLFLAKVDYLYEHPTESSRDEIEFNNGMVLDRYSAPILSVAGKNYGRIWTFRDVTNQKLAEKALIIAKEHAEESDRLKSAFLANMSHEIRTPMNGILGFAEILKEPKLTGEEQQEYIGIIEKSGERMLNIINDIINISKVESGLMEVSFSETSVYELIDFIFNFFKIEAEQKEIKLIYSKPSESIDDVISTDREKVYAILTNLVKNALKFTHQGSVEFGYKKVDGFLEFFVADTGVGISKEHIEFIFERFRQGNDSLSRDYEGAGLGLSISKAYIEMLGGKIWVESILGNGSVFYFTLPYDILLVKNNKELSIASNSIVEGQIKKLKILIAEDDEISQFYISQAVNVFADEIFIAKNGVEAVNLCKNISDLDLILMDIKMPVMDGYEATRLIRQFNSSVIIVAQTAFALTGDQEKAIEAGCTDYISKPVKKNELLLLLKKYF